MGLKLSPNPHYQRLPQPHIGGNSLQLGVGTFYQNPKIFPEKTIPQRPWPRSPPKPWKKKTETPQSSHPIVIAGAENFPQKNKANNPRDWAIVIVTKYKFSKDFKK